VALLSGALSLSRTEPYSEFLIYGRLVLSFDCLNLRVLLKKSTDIVEVSSINHWSSIPACYPFSYRDLINSYKLYVLITLMVNEMDSVIFSLQQRKHWVVRL
jgi:hypothetical protein